MRHAAIAPQIEIPLESLARQVGLLDALQHQVIVSKTLAPADDFPVTLRREHIHAKRHFRALRIRRHIEGLHLAGIAVDEHGPVEILGDDGLVGAAEIAAPLNLAALLLEHFHGVVVAQARERQLDLLEVGHIAPQRLQLRTAELENALNHEGHQFFPQHHRVVEVGEGHLRLDHPKLRQVATGLGLLGAEGGPEAVGLAHRHGRRLVVKLAGLCEVGFIVEIVHLEERGGALAGRGREDGRVHQGEAAAVEEVAHRFDDLVPDAQDGALAHGTQPEMTMVHQELDAVLFEGDGIRVLDRDQLLDLEVGHIQFEAARSTFIRAHLAGDSQRRFLGQNAYPLKELRRNRALHHHTLNQARAVAEERKQKLAALSQVIEPPLDKNFLANVIRYASNLNRGNQGYLPRLVVGAVCCRRKSSTGC